MAERKALELEQKNQSYKMLSDSDDDIQEEKQTFKKVSSMTHT